VPGRGKETFNHERLEHEPNARANKEARESHEVYNAGIVMSAANPTKIAGSEGSLLQVEA